MCTTSQCARFSLLSSPPPPSSLVPLLLVGSITEPAYRHWETTPGQTQLAWAPAGELPVPNEGPSPGHVSLRNTWTLLTAVATKVPGHETSL